MRPGRLESVSRFSSLSLSHPFSVSIIAFLSLSGQCFRKVSFVALSCPESRGLLGRPYHRGEIYIGRDTQPLSTSRLVRQHVSIVAFN
jgi:hypothetical protein